MTTETTQDQNELSAKAIGSSPQMTQSDWDNITGGYSRGFIQSSSKFGTYKEIKPQTVKNYLANPQLHINDIEGLMAYAYRAFPEIGQLYNNVRNLPDLKYQINVMNKPSNAKKHSKAVDEINQGLQSVSYKQLTRDLLAQIASSCAVIATWLKNDQGGYYLHIFDDNDLCHPHHMENGEWVAAIKLDVLKQKENNYVLKSFSDKNRSPYTAQQIKDSERKSSEIKEIFLPIESTAVIRFNTLSRNTPYGIPMGLNAVLSLLHKKHLQDLEKSVANKIIGSIIVLTVGETGSKDWHDNNWTAIPQKVKSGVLSGVENALNSTKENGTKVVSIPNFVKYEAQDNKVENTLDPEKYENINKDISTAIGLASAVMNGEGGNYQSAKLSLENFYKQIGSVLELIETLIWDKYFNLIISGGNKAGYSLEFNKKVPLLTSEMMTSLMSLHTSEGFALKPILDLLGVNFDEYVEQSLYELENLKLQDHVKPYLNAHTSSGDEEAGRPSIEDPENENTAKNKANQD